MKSVPRAASRAVLVSTVPLLEIAWIALLDNIKVKKNKPPASIVQMAGYQTLEELRVKNQHTSLPVTAIILINISTNHHSTKTTGRACHVHQVLTAQVTLTGVRL